MATVSTRLVTADEFFDFVNRPENRDRIFELEAGEIVEMSRPGELHGAVCGNLAGLFFIYLRSLKKGRVLANDAGLLLDRDPDTVRGPDLSIYTDTKKFADLAPKWIEDLPTLVIEVRSPNDVESRMVRRLNRFLDRGAQAVAIVDPSARSVTVWWEAHAPIVFEDGEDLANLPGLPDFRCKVSEIFDTHGE